MNTPIPHFRAGQGPATGSKPFVVLSDAGAPIAVSDDQGTLRALSAHTALATSAEISYRSLHPDHAERAYIPTSAYAGTRICPPTCDGRALEGIWTDRFL